MDTIGRETDKKKCKGTGARNLLQLDSRLEKKFNSGENTKSNLIPFTRKKKYTTSSLLLLGFIKMVEGANGRGIRAKGMWEFIFI